MPLVTLVADRHAFAHPGANREIRGHHGNRRHEDCAWVAM
jgi:hypothetical protein